MSPFEVSDDMGVWKGSFVGVEVMVQFWFGKTSIVTKNWVIFLLSSMPNGGFVVCMSLCVGRHINLLAIYIGRLLQVIQIPQLWVNGK